MSNPYYDKLVEDAARAMADDPVVAKLPASVLRYTVWWGRGQQAVDAVLAGLSTPSERMEDEGRLRFAEALAVGAKTKEAVHLIWPGMIGAVKAE